MLSPRIIPCLLLHKNGLYKTVQFESPKYVGDPINAVRIFNEKEVDELIFLDIDSTVLGAEPNYELIATIASECQMPLSIGGGIKTLEQAKKINSLGVEKILLSSAAISDSNLLTRMADVLGKQSVVAVLDVKKKKGLFSDSYEIMTHNGKNRPPLNFFDTIAHLQSQGVGEVVVNSIDKDGMMNGYDVNLAKKVKKCCEVPFTMLGGAGSLEHMRELFENIGLVGAAAGSMFVFKGKYRAVLINYPSKEQKQSLF